MKTFVVLMLSLVGAAAQLPPYQRNPITTNAPAGMTNVVTSISGIGDEAVRQTIIDTNALLSGYVDQQDSAIRQTIVDTNALLRAYVDAKEEFTNLSLVVPQWVDAQAVYAYSVTGPNAPSLTAVTNGSVIQMLAFDNGDILHASVQLPHNIAITNAAFPQWIWNPHIHWVPLIATTPTTSNVTWRIEWDMGDVNGVFSLRGTNQVTEAVTNSHIHRVTGLGPITNPVPPSISAFIRMRITRPASASQEYGNSHIVLFLGEDIHIPVGNDTTVGSRQEFYQ